MNEYLMIAHEMEKARLLARQAKKSRHAEEPSLTIHDGQVHPPTNSKAVKICP
jgi:hypothetical protein